MSRHVNSWHPLVNRSVEILREHQDPGGAWPASPAFAPYQYSWCRDGSFIAEGASAAGLLDEADRFHGWCRRVLERERDAVDKVVAMLEEGSQPEDSDYLPARYNLDGSRHVDDWWNFQVDGYGTWLSAPVRVETVLGELAVWVGEPTSPSPATGATAVVTWPSPLSDQTLTTVIRPSSASTSKSAS